MVRRHMVRYPIQHQIHPSLRKLCTGNSETFWTSEMLVNYVAPDAVGRSDVVIEAKVRKCSPKILD
jgi:hypothetical protein